MAKGGALLLACLEISMILIVHRGVFSRRAQVADMTGAKLDKLRALIEEHK